MLSRLIILLLPMVSQADINFTFNIDNDNNVNVEYRTEPTIDVISEKEWPVFGISNECLKEAAKVFSGKKPDDVFVRSPTPWGDLYNSNNWPQVTRTLRPINIELIKTSSGPLNLLSKYFKNNSIRKVVFFTSVTKGITNTLRTTWPVKNELEVVQNITYEFKTNGGNKYYADFFKSKWGDEVAKAITHKIGLRDSVEINLEPQNKVVVNLTAVRFSADVKVTYMASLDGDVACYYGSKYKGYYFWAYNISDLLDAAQIPKQKVFIEFINIKFYTYGKVEVSDVNSSKTIFETIAAII